MLDVSARKVKGFSAKLADEIRFIRNWAENPLTTGAVSPSGPDLTRRMASFIERDRPGAVLELGPGTGVVTHAILDRDIATERVIALEYNEDFCRLLRRRYPDMDVVEGDAYSLRIYDRDRSHGEKGLPGGRGLRGGRSSQTTSFGPNVYSPYD